MKTEDNGLAFPPEYFGTRFQIEAHPRAWPQEFTIVTAWAPTGETRPAARNEEADVRLRDSVRAAGLWHHRITGYDPSSDHAEPGWAIEQSLADGIALGVEFEQVGIFQVVDGELWVVLCAQPDGGRRLDPFFERLDDPDVPSGM